MHADGHNCFANLSFGANMRARIAFGSRTEEWAGYVDSVTGDARRPSEMLGRGGPRRTR